MIAADHPTLIRAYRLKERLRLLLKLPHHSARVELDAWLAWAQRCRIPEFVRLGRSIRTHREAILDAIRYGLSNARTEAINNKIKLTIRMGYGFRNVDNLVALVMLKCGGHAIGKRGSNQGTRTIWNRNWSSAIHPSVFYPHILMKPLFCAMVRGGNTW